MPAPSFADLRCHAPPLSHPYSLPTSFAPSRIPQDFEWAGTGAHGRWFGWRPFIKVALVKEEELEGYRMWLDSKGGYF